MPALSDPTVTQDGAALADELGADDLAGENGHGPAEALDATIADSAGHCRRAARRRVRHRGRAAAQAPRPRPLPQRGSGLSELDLRVDVDGAPGRSTG